MKSKRRGVTLIEMMLSMGLTVLVLLGSIGLFVFGLSTWMRGQARIDANGTSEHAVRSIAISLREAMSITVDGNGLGLTYQRPTKTSGAFNYPLTYDNVTRRIYLDANGNIQESANGADVHKICSNVISTDPSSGAAYRIFTAGNGALVRSITIMVVTRRSNYRTEQVSSRSREVMQVRNIPVQTH